MYIYNLKSEQYLPIAIEQAWDFFSVAGNLSKITPPSMDFQILTRLNNEPIYTGMKIEYKVTPLLNIRMNWVTKIVAVKAPFCFTDLQLRGPYALWEHTHEFSTVKGGIIMKDNVRYALPLGWLGRLAQYLFVRRQLDSIFNFRREKLIELFGSF